MKKKNNLQNLQRNLGKSRIANENHAGFLWHTTSGQHHNSSQRKYRWRIKSIRNVKNLFWTPPQPAIIASDKRAVVSHQLPSCAQNRSTLPQHSDVWIPKLTHPPPTPILGIKENFSPLALNLELSSGSQGYCGHQPNEGLAQEPGDNTELPQ